jgi:hypothetical protein
VGVLDELLERAAAALAHDVHVEVVLKRAVEREEERVLRAQLRHGGDLVLQVQRVRHCTVKGGLLALAGREILVHDLHCKPKFWISWVVAERHDHAVPASAEHHPVDDGLERRPIQPELLVLRVEAEGTAEGSHHRFLRP